MERASIHCPTRKDAHVDGCIRSRLGSNHAQSRGNLRLVQHIRGSHRPERIQCRHQCHQSVPTARHRASSPRRQHGVLLLPEEMGRSHPKVKQSHPRIMGLLPADERVHRCTLCAQQAQPSQRVEPSTSDVDGSITGPVQHGNDLEDIFVDRYGSRLDGKCGEQAMSKVYFRVPSTGGVRGGHFCSTSAKDIARFLQPAVAYDPRSSSLSGGGDQIQGSSRGSIPSAETMVAQVPVFGATHDHNPSSNLSSSK